MSTVAYHSVGELVEALAGGRVPAGSLAYVPAVMQSDELRRAAAAVGVGLVETPPDSPRIIVDLWPR